MNAERIHDARAVLLWAARAGGIVLIGWGVFLVSARLLYGLIGTGQIRTAWTVWMDIGETHGIFRGLPLIAIGALLVIFGRPLVRWIVAAPGSGCPSCGYPEGTGAEARCTECGYRSVGGSG